MRRRLSIVLLLLLAAGIVAYLITNSPIQREWTPAVSLSEVRTGGLFVARIDGVQYGYRTSLADRPFAYVLISVTTSDGKKMGLIELKPRSNIIRFAESLKAGSYYAFPRVLEASSGDGNGTINPKNIIQ